MAYLRSADSNTDTAEAGSVMACPFFAFGGWPFECMMHSSAWPFECMAARVHDAFECMAARVHGRSSACRACSCCAVTMQGPVQWPCGHMTAAAPRP